MGITARQILDSSDEKEVVLEILGYSGGENTVSEDHIAKVNEARTIENWEAVSLGGMQRARGFNEVATASGSVASDLAHFHFEIASGSGEFLGLLAGDLVKQDGTSISTVGASKFTTDILSHATNGETASWITNSTNNLKRYTIALGVHTPPSQPATARERIYRHKSRLIAEGGGVRIYVSRAGVGNWTNKSVGAVVFAGSGLNDATSGGTYTGFAADVYEVEIDLASGTDTFKWRKNGGSYTTGVSITGAAQTLSDGVTITFGATTGHTLGDEWTITISGNAWSLSNDASNIDLPNSTRGCAVGFPSGDIVTVFDEFRAYLLSGFPNTRFDPIPNSRGCAAPYSIAVGDEGVYFVSNHPTLGVFLWTGTEFIDLTKQNEDVFTEKINLNGRVFGTYRNRKYYLFYNETNSGVSYPNRLRIYNAKFGGWMNRPVNSALSDSFGYPALLTDQANELYVWSSQKKKVYELETDDNSDEGNETQANYKTKDFSSADFSPKGSDKSFPIDEALLKITKVTMTYSGTVGVVTLQWTADRGRTSGSVTFDLSASGDQLNTTLTVNSSSVISSGSIADRKVTKSFKNSAVGRTFNFQLLNNGTSTRPKIKKIKIHGLVLSED